MRPHFQEVKLDQGDPQPGDLYMFQLQSSRAERCGAHVGVYCGHGEIIHFEGEQKPNLSSHEGVGWDENSLKGEAQTGMGLQFEEMLSLICTVPAIPTGSTSRSGVVSKQSLSDMKRYGGQLLHVFRKCSGVDPGVLGHSVQRAMSSDPPRYHPRSSNCVHFALDLLSMD